MLHFSDEEKRKIRRLYSLEHYRKPWAITAGIGTSFLVFASQGVLYAQPHFYHFIATYGCLPAGAVAGIATYHLIARHVNQQFKRFWDPLYYQRSGKSPETVALQREEIEATDGP
ncbi:hypothetical protein VO226_08245 [Halomonas elongata]|uniref:hypothetical protein n=1 Tax=Halomonas elongata TaxID=2746 RepID=UPI002E29F7A3|nr:hypothetical protein [Halomonas elongata]WVI73222.1 hypothetical protein VO226_08245 [Halomonas elongata]